MAGAPIDRNQLFARLARSGPAPASVVTPNRRLAQSLEREFDAFQLSRGLAVWDAPDILPFGAFVERAYEDALYSELAGELPVLLAPDQEQQLWEDLLRADYDNQLLAIPEAAASARDAWQLAHAWRLMPRLESAALDDDAQAFVGWARRYSRRTRRDGLTDRARLPEVVASVLGHARVKKPALYTAYGFDILTPQHRSFMHALAGQGTELRTCTAQRSVCAAVRFALADARDEIRHAARWARARLEAGGPGTRIAVVVPDIAQHRHAIRRTFTQTMAPGAPAPAADAGVLPFEISLGEPLAAYPLVAHALLALELAGREIDFARASLLIRSPFLAAGETEREGRARLDAALRAKAEPALDLERLLMLIGRESHSRAPVLAAKLQELAQFRKARLFGTQGSAAWARAFSEALALVGFPGERGLTSPEYQTLKKFHDLVARFSRLERVTGGMGFRAALARLHRMAAQTLFQPETPEVPIQVLGVLEAAGMTFDHAWIMGLSDEAWPLAPQPNPFIPVALQRAENLPQASPAAALALAERLTAELLGCAGEVVLSHPQMEGDRRLGVSPLVAHVPAHPSVHSAADLFDPVPDIPAYPLWRDVIHANLRLERSEDRQAPALLDAEDVRGGTQVLKNQAACPFRAFALHRLGAAALEAPHTGLDPLERGSLVHQVLADAWRALGTKAGLDRIPRADLDAVLDTAAAAAIARIRRDRPTTLGGRFAGIEHQRLVRLARDWLELERERGEFSVVAIEDRRSMQVGGLTLAGRLDRVDETEAGERIVIDYKTGEPKAGDWIGARMDEPQLPLYLTATEPAAKALAFAQVKAGRMKFVALAAAAGVLPAARTLPNAQLKRAAASWEAQLVQWRADLVRLAEGFGSGDAAVDPKRGACDQCDLQPLCRIHERTDGGQ